jgi:hypothetical protein
MVKRLRITIDEGLDAALARRASEEGVSRAALVRRYVEERLRLSVELDRKLRAAEELLAAVPVPVPETVEELKSELRPSRGR